MRITAKEAKRIAVSLAAAPSEETFLSFVCDCIYYAATEGKSETSFMPELKLKVREWLLVNGFELKDEGDTTIVSWKNVQI